MTQTNVRDYDLRTQDTISDQNCWRYSPPENIVPAQYSRGNHSFG